MSNNKENIIHRRQFQNANQIVTVEVKSKAKGPVATKVVHNAFKRNCALRNEIEKVNKKNPKLRTVVKKQKEINEKEEECNKKKNKVHKRVKRKGGDSSWMEFLIAKNILPQDEIGGVNTEKDTTLDSEKNSIATSTNRRQIPIHKHFSKATRHKNISLQCNMSQEAETVPVRYIRPNAIESRQRDDKIKLKEMKNFTNHHKTSGINENPQKEVSPDQTHTPFGDSALHLILQLREHLRSRGHSESSDLVNQIEAAIIGSGSGKRHTDGKDEVFKFPSTPDDDSQKESIAPVNSKDQITIESQEAQIKQLQKLNDNLRVLSAKLLEYHQKVAKYPPVQHISHIDETPVKLSHNDNVASETEELESRQGLKLERDALLKKIQSQKDLIFNLEVRLEKTENELQRMRADFNSLSARSGVSPVVSGFEANQKISKVANWNRPDRVNVASKEPIRSDTDSAFDDRSVSLSNSKRSSPRRSIVERILGARVSTAHKSIGPREAVAFVTEKENLSLTQRSDYPDDDGANVMLEKAFPADVSQNTDAPQLYVSQPPTTGADQFYEGPEVPPATTYPGIVMESTRISSDNLSPKPSKLIVDLGSDVYYHLQAEQTSS